MNRSRNGEAMTNKRGGKQTCGCSFLIVVGKKSIWSNVMDHELLTVIQGIRSAGGEVHLVTVSTHAKAIVRNHKLGGYLDLKKSSFGNAWSSRWLRSHGFSRRAGTRAKKVKIMTEKIRSFFLQKVALICALHKIPPLLVVNFDETGLELVPAGKRTFHTKGSVQVEIVGLDDKRQITAGLAASMAGEKLPMQLIFQGTTLKCLPTTKNPVNSRYYFSHNHWQTPETTLQYLEEVVFPFFIKKKEENGLPADQWSLLIWDIWYTHIHIDIRAACDKNFVKIAVVTPGFTSHLQVMDVAVNSTFKCYWLGIFCLVFYYC